MALELFLIFGCAYFLLSMQGSLPLDQRMHNALAILIVAVDLIVAAMIVVPALR